MEADGPTIHWFRAAGVSYITTGASGSSFEPTPLLGKCVAN
jgi:hypothetical protein